MVRFSLAVLAALAVAAPAVALPLDPTQLVTVSSGTSGGNDAFFANGAEGVREAITPDGRYVAFTDRSSNLTATPDSNGAFDVFWRDLQTGQTKLVSVNAAGTAAGNANAGEPGISDDGRYVVFSSPDTDLVAGFTGSVTQVFVRDMQTGTTSLVSRTTASATAGGNNVSSAPVISGNGHVVAWLGRASDLESPDVVSGSIAKDQLYARDLQTQTTSFVTIAASGSAVGNANFTGQYSLTPDGRFVSFSTGSNNLVAGYTSPGNGITEVYRRDLQTATTALVSATTTGPTEGTNGTNGIWQTQISDDGRYVAFDGNGLNMVAGLVDHDGLGGYDVYLRDMASATTTLVSGTSATDTGNGFSDMPRMTPDGRYVLFTTYASDLVPGDVNAHADLVRWDRTSGTRVAVSVPSAGTTPAGSGTGSGAISSDGSRVAFDSDAAALAGGGSDNVFLRDITAGTTQLLSSLPGDTTSGGNDDSYGAWLNANGTRVLWASRATDLITGFADLNGSAEDLFTRAVTVAPPVENTGDPGGGGGSGGDGGGDGNPPSSTPPAGDGNPLVPPGTTPETTGTPRPHGVTRRGTRKRDVLVGTRYADRLIGLAGDDSLKGLGGRDVLLGGPGDDRIDAADGVRDVVDCGPGRHDRATVDKLDKVRRCETVKRR